MVKMDLLAPKSSLDLSTLHTTDFMSPDQQSGIHFLIIFSISC